MDDSTATHAMTEIALALAMAFFALMILTLVSMGSGQIEAEQSQAFESLDMVAPAQQTSQAASTLSSDDMMLIHDGQRFLSQDLKTLPEATVKQRVTTASRVILAIPPTLAFDQAMRIRSVLGDAPVVVTPLTEDWMTRLNP